MKSAVRKCHPQNGGLLFFGGDLLFVPENGLLLSMAAVAVTVLRRWNRVRSDDMAGPHDTTIGGDGFGDLNPPPPPLSQNFVAITL